MAAEHDLSLARFRQAATEAANRAEVTALLIRCGYRVYRPEADIEGEDLVIRHPTGALFAVQLKGSPIVDCRRYGGRGLWLLCPSAAYTPSVPRSFFLLPHDPFFDWVKTRHGHAPSWADHWRYPAISKALAAFLAEYQVRPSAESAGDAKDSN